MTNSKKEEKSKENLKCKKCANEFDTLAKLKIHEESCAEFVKLQPELEGLKQEILGEARPPVREKRSLSWGSAAVTLVLVFLALFSIAQTIQSAAILKKVNSGDIGQTSGGASGASSGLPSNVQNLPNMVGGC